MDATRIGSNESKTTLVLPNLSYKLMGILFGAHSELGSTLLEKYYQRAIAKGLAEAGLEFKREVPTELTYKGKSIGRYFLDFLIEDLIILEVKAEKGSANRHFQQATAYLKKLNRPLAIVANFRRQKLAYKRIVNPNYKGFDLSSPDQKYSSNSSVGFYSSIESNSKD